MGNNWSPTFSPDGHWIAFISDRAGQPSVWVMRTDGTSDAKQLTRYHEDSPAWSPDGSTIAFVSRWTGEPSLWLMNADLVGENLFIVGGASATKKKFLFAANAAPTVSVINHWLETVA